MNPIARRAFLATLRVHQTVYERSGGNIGHRVLGGLPTLLLRSTGRRSGLTRTNALVYARDGERYIVVPSNGGADVPPAWLHNIKAAPDVEVQVARTRFPATAGVVDRDDPEFARLWELVNRSNGGRYDAYQRQTARPIPVVALTPRTP